MATPATFRKLIPPRQRIDWRDIKPRVDLARVATKILGSAAKSQGRRLLWPCPFHDDRNPSLVVDPDRGTWVCWPCNLRGDAAALVRMREGLTFPEAVRRVAELCGIDAPPPVRKFGTKPPTPTDLGSVRPSPNLGKASGSPPGRSSGLAPADAHKLVTEAAARLWSPEGTAARQYLHGRGLDDEIIRSARLGVVDSVMLPTREGDRCFRAGGVVIPWFDGDRLALVKVRQLEGMKPKYAEAFRDRPTIYPGPEAIGSGRPLVITEGEFDALLLGQELCGLAAVVTLGSASGKPDLNLLSDMLPAAPWFLALDGDEAGDKAAAAWPARAIRVRPPDGVKDWTELWQAAPASIRYHWGRYLPMSARPEDMPWGDLSEPAGNEPDLCALAEREAIQNETPLETTDE